MHQVAILDLNKSFDKSAAQISVSMAVATSIEIDPNSKKIENIFMRHFLNLGWHFLQLFLSTIRSNNHVLKCVGENLLGEMCKNVRLHAGGCEFFLVKRTMSGVVTTIRLSTITTAFRIWLILATIHIPYWSSHKQPWDHFYYLRWDLKFGFVPHSFHDKWACMKHPFHPTRFKWEKNIMAPVSSDKETPSKIN